MAQVPLPTPTDNEVPSTDIRDAVYAGAMLDKVVTSRELTYTARDGSVHVTVDGMKAEGDTVVEETRQNLIPLSRQYMTLADAQADIANIPDGSTTYVRSEDGSSLADEYINSAGTLTATGRKMPSQNYVELSDASAQREIFSNRQALSVTDYTLSKMALMAQQKMLSFTAAGSRTFTSEDDVTVFVGQISANESSDARARSQALKFSATSSNGTVVVASVLPGERFVDGVIDSPYHALDLTGIAPGTVLLDDTNSVFRMIFSNITLQNTTQLIAPYSVIDTSGVFTAGNTGGYAYDKKSCSMYGVSTPYIQLTIPYAEIIAAGYTPDAAGGVKYYIDKLTSVVINYKTTDITKKNANFISQLPAGAITITADKYLVISANVYHYNGQQKPEFTSSSLARYICDASNDTTKDYSGLIELKVSFPAGLVMHHADIAVTDKDGNYFAGQFAGEDFVNLRFQSNEGFWPDGSFKTGAVWINDTITAGQKKYYNIDIYANTKQLTTYPTLDYYAPTEGNKRFNITVGAITCRFSWTTYYYGLTSVDSSPNDDVNRLVIGLSTQHRYLDGTTQKTEYFTENVTLKLSNNGPLFSEVERVAYNAASATYTAGVLKSTTRYRIFNNGQIQVRNLVTAVSQIPVGKMLGAFVPITLVYQIGVVPDFNFSSPAAIISGTPVGNGGFSVVPTIVNGDIHRDGTDGGPTRQATISMSHTPETQTLAIRAGWLTSSSTDYSFLNWPVEKNWTWSAEVWINTQETESENFALASKVLNRPVAFAATGILPNFAVKRAEGFLLGLMDGVADFWMNGDSSGIGGMTPPLNLSSPSQLTPFGYLACRELRKPNGTLTVLLPAFISYLNTYYSGTGLGAAYLSGSRTIADLVATVLKPMISFYRAAEYLGETNVTTALKPYITNFADAMVTTVNNKGGIPNKYTDSGTGATNINIYGLLLVALSIKSGFDTSGQYQTCYNTVISLLTNTSTIFRYTPTLVDSQPVTTSLSRSRWYNYDIDLTAEYLIMNDMLGVAPVFNNITYGLHGLCGDGRIRTIDYIISESRRGLLSTPVSVALTMMMSRSVSTGNALVISMQAYERDYLTDPYASGRFYDHSPILGTGMPTDISSHNRVMLEMLAGYFVNSMVKQ